MMKPIELINQILERQPFSCTEKQMRFLKQLVLDHESPDSIRAAEAFRRKKVITALKRNLTLAQKEYEKAKQELSEAEKNV